MSTPAAPTTATTLVDACRRRALHDGTRTGYVFQPDGDEPERELTFAELDRRARAIAAVLAQRVEPGARALLHHPPGLDFLAGFFGCLYAGVIAIPAPPIEGSRADSAAVARCRAIAASAKPELLLSVRASLDRLSPDLLRAGGLDAVHAIATDEVAATWAERWREPVIDARTIAYLQYSSGSTGAPKGVMLTHGNVLHNLAAIRDLCASATTPVGAFWLPMFHDMGLVGGGLMPVATGGRVRLMSPLAFVQQPFRWLSALGEPGSISAAPNFAYELCAQRVSDRQLARLDLSGWTCAIVGAERVRPATLERFAARFAACGFRAESFAPCYGLAESTLLVTGGPLGRGPAVRRFALSALQRHEIAPAATGEAATALVGCGAPRPGLRIVVADPDTLAPSPPGRIGEVLVSGESVGVGYWGAPEETAAAFGAAIDGVEGRFLRTGDLGAVVDGELYLSGRRKELVIVDGQNHHPPDLEATAEAAHPAIRRGFCAVVAVDDGRRERVVVLAEVGGRALRAGDPAELAEEIATAVRRALSEGHRVAVDEVVALRSGSLPLTSSGKLQRLACRAGLAAGRFDGRRVVPATTAIAA